VQFSSFSEFVTTSPLEGLGATLDQLRGICRSDPEALDAIDRATQNAPYVHTGDVALSNIRNSPTGTTSAAALRRLRKDRPDLAERVVRGTSAHLHPKPADTRLSTARWAELQIAAKMVEATRRDVAGSAVIVQTGTVIREEADPG